MPSGDKPGRKRILGLLAFALLLVVILPVLGRALSVGVSLAIVLGYLFVILLGYAIFVIGMPLFFWIMGEAGYRTFLKPYFRVWHIRRIRNRRLWDEAAAREDADSG